MRSIVVAVVPLVLLVGCSGTDSGSDCVSHYEPAADAPTLSELGEQLRGVDPRVWSMKVVDKHPDERKVYVHLLDHRRRAVMSVEAWRLDDGTWTAQLWQQCVE